VSPNGNYLCSYVDSVITLWDPRNIKSPLRQIQSSKNHLQIAWCPTRTSLLSSLLTDQAGDTPSLCMYLVRTWEWENLMASFLFHLFSKRSRHFRKSNNKGVCKSCKYQISALNG